VGWAAVLVLCGPAPFLTGAAGVQGLEARPYAMAMTVAAMAVSLRRPDK